MKTNWIIKIFYFAIINVTALFFYPHRSFGNIRAQPQLTVEEGYDSNLFLNTDNKVGDHLTLISPGAYISLYTLKTKTDISYKASYSFYHKIVEFNNETHHAVFSGDYILSERLKLVLSDRFNISIRELFDDLKNLRSSIVSKRQKRIQNDLDSTLYFSPTGKSLLSFYYSSSYDDVEVSFEVDENYHSGGMKFNYYADTAKRFTIFSDIGIASYKFSYNQGIKGANRNFFKSSYTGGLDYRLSRTCSMTIYGGASFNSYENSLIKDDSHIVFGGDVKKDFNIFSINTSYSQNIASNGGLGGAQVEERYSAVIDIDPSPMTKLTLSGIRTDNRFINDLDDSTSSFRRSDFTTWQGKGRFLFNPFYWLNISADYIYYLTDYKKKSVGFNDYYYQNASANIEVTIQKYIYVELSYIYKERFLVNRPASPGEYTDTVVKITVSYRPDFLIE